MPGRETAEETGVRLSPGALHPWSRWITPEPLPLRYDTWFYVAACPAGQEAWDASGETTHAAWARPADALADAESGRVIMLPPTVATLTELAELGTLTAVLAEPREVHPILPRLVGDAGGWHFAYPVA